MFQSISFRPGRWLGALGLASAMLAACSASQETGESSEPRGGRNGTGGEGSNTGEETGGASPGAGNASGSGGAASGGGSGSGASGGGNTGAAGASGGLVTGGPRFPGSGTGYSGSPLIPGLGPSTASECTQPPDIGPKVTVKDQGRACFFGDGAKSPAATVEHILESVGDKEFLHVRVTFDPYFVDNTYGKTGIGWNPRRPHTFVSDLTKSDHVQIIVNDGAGAKVMDFKVDYISADPSKPCGYGTLGVNGGDGGMTLGNPAHILAASTSLDRNLNGCGYCQYTVDSPVTDDSYTPNPATPNWDYRVVYEVWIDPAAFGAAGFGNALVEFVHASPAKADDDTVVVKSGPCPPDWDVPYCPPHLVGEGTACGGQPPGAGGSTGAGGNTGAGGASSGGATGQCPPGYVPDIQTEGRTCVPE